MAEDGRIVYKVECDTSGMESQASAGGHRAGNALEEVMTGAARRIGEAFINMAQQAVQGIEQIVQAGVEFNAKMEKYQTGLTTLLGSAEEAAAVMEQIRKDAASTPFDVDSLTQANQMLISTGMSAADARKDVLNLANAVAATGGGSAELSRMAANMQQIKNVGKATAMDIRQFAMAGINIYGLLADATGKTTEEVKDMEVSYELLSAALEKAAADGGKYAGAMEAQSQTFNGRISTLKDNVMQLEGSLTEDLFNHLSGTALPMVMDWVATLLEASQTGGIEGAFHAAESIISNLISTIVDNLPEMINTGTQMLLSFAKGIQDRLPQIVSTGVQLLGKLIEGIANNLPALIHGAAELIRTFWKAIIDNLPQILEAGGRLLKALLNGILQYVGEVAVTAMELASELIDTLKNTDWLSVGKNIIDGISEGFMKFWNNLSDQVVNAMNNLLDSVKSFFGIASPSKVFEWIGEMNVEGLEKGFEDQQASLIRTVHNVFDTVPDAALDAVSSADIERSISYQMTGSTPNTQITIPLFLDGREIARATAWSMGEQLAWEEM